jgi:hypothetical protein
MRVQRCVGVGFRVLVLVLGVFVEDLCCGSYRCRNEGYVGLKHKTANPLFYCTTAQTAPCPTLHTNATLTSVLGLSLCHHYIRTMHPDHRCYFIRLDVSSSSNQSTAASSDGPFSWRSAHRHRYPRVKCIASQLKALAIKSTCT